MINVDYSVFKRYHGARERVVKMAQYLYDKGEVNANQLDDIAHIIGQADKVEQIAKEIEQAKND